MLETPSRHRWAVALRGVAVILLVVWPAAAVPTLIVPIGIAAIGIAAIGVAAIAFDITLLTLGLRLRRERRHDPAAAGHHHRPATA